ncbi:ice-binding family protein [Pontibacter akesuensis]|nr:ice-binding family protein [Pontibacter akesuensis]
MIKNLLLTFLILIGGYTQSMAQEDPTVEVLGRASSFAVLSSTTVTNTGTTVIYGNLGTLPVNALQDNGLLIVSKKEIGTVTAAQAMEDATGVYTSIAAKSVDFSHLRMPSVLLPGVHQINGDANLNDVLQGTITFDGRGDVNAKFYVIVKGDLKNSLPVGGIASVRVNTTNGAEAKNIYWIVENNVNLTGVSLFEGSVLAKGNINLAEGVYLNGRIISLEGRINLNANLIYLPNVIYTDLNVKKEAEGGSYTVGANIRYTITVTNAGPGTATGVVITENFPQGGLEFVTYTTAKGTFGMDADGKYRWHVGDLQNGEVAVITVVFKLLVAGEINNQVTIDPNPNNPDPEPNDNNDEDPVVVCAVPTLDITPSTSYCGITPTDITFTVTEVAGATYDFTVLPTGWSLVSQSNNTAVIRVAAPGTLQVKVTDRCNTVYTVTEQLVLPTKPAPPTIQGAATVCANSTDNTYTVTGYGAGVTYLWTPVGDVRIVGEATGSSVQVSAGTNGGSLTLVVSNSCLSSNVATKAIGITATPATPASVTGQAVVCAGTTQTYRTDAVAGATSYTWNLPTGWAVVPGTPANEREIQVTVGFAGGNISVAANGVCESSAASAPLSITVNSKPAKPVIEGVASACNGQTITLTAREVAGITDYDWTTPAGWAVVSGGDHFRSVTLRVGAAAGTVTLAVVNACGTGDEIAEVAVSPLGGPDAPTVSGTTEVCENTQALTYSVASPVEDITYTWAVTGGISLVQGASTGTSVKVNAGTTGGTITVTASNGCSSTASQPLQVNVSTPPAILGQITDNSNVCDGLVYTIDPVQSATSYAWRVTAGFTIVSGQGTNTITVKADNATARFGTVSVTAINGPCSSTTAATAPMDASLVEGQLNLPKAFSPNGDGKNDTWFISNLEKFPVNEVTIFNRWGSEVYKKTGYQNDWMGKGLEQGTYFYKVRVTVCGGIVKEFTGYVTLFR